MFQINSPKNDLAEQKIAFIREVSEIENEKTLSALIAAYLQITAPAKADAKPKPIRKKFDAEAIRHSRGGVGHDKDKIMGLIREMDIQEPIEQLLSQLSK
ncbi:MAG: hypothetical protein SH848_17920 [Saprospiraceae bacterium]|nr:hypothetical protein [Saprospiraceae bacterium]MDZ4705810.1 hypothetical protein [Saprospiraceae bacterium]